MGLPRPFELVVQHGTEREHLGGTAICGFTTKGAVGAIAVDWVIKTFGMEQLGSVLSESFPAMALVRGRRPQHPVRIYQGDGIGAFVSDIAFPDEFNLSFAETVIKWFRDGGFDRLVMIDGVFLPNMTGEDTPPVFGVGSTDASRARLEEIGLESVEHGIVPGITGYLLAEADRQGFEAYAILSPSNPGFPDARAALPALEALSEMLDRDIPLEGLMEKAIVIEQKVREMMQEHQLALPEPKIDETSDDDPMVL